jgi:rieske iron-sulfur protein
VSDGKGTPEGLSRRRLLAAGMGVGFGIGGASLLVAIGGLVPRIRRTSANQPVQKGDILVFATGPNQGRAITPDDVPEDGPQVLAWPMEPANQVVRDQNHLNIILLVRAGRVGWFSAAEAPRTAAGVAAYSATCTHLCCSVSQWIPRPFGVDRHGYLFCPCHKSHYDPWDGARVLAGPAPRPLPALPLALSGTNLVAASGFLAPPGCSLA